MSARISRLGASFVFATALSAPLLMHAGTASAATCAPNADISSSGCGNAGPGNSGFNNSGSGNSGTDNTGKGNSGTLNVGNGNSGVGNVGNGNSGCFNTGTANSGGGNVGTGLSGGNTSCTPTTGPPPTLGPPAPGHHNPGVTSAAVPEAEPGILTSQTGTLPLTGNTSTAPIALAVGLLISGSAAVALANRRRMASAGLNGTTTESPVPLSAALGMLLTGGAARNRGDKSSS